MSLAEEYARQRAWRSPGPVLDALPPCAGRTVLDLGCGVGDGAVELVARGARVIGLDSNAALLAAAEGRGLPRGRPGAEFLAHDLRDELPELGPVDGLWCSFAAAYFPELAPALERWTRPLRPGGWVALIEVDDLFGHAPLEARTSELLEAYARDSLLAGRYDFHMGRRLSRALVEAGLDTVVELELPDAELAFQGPAAPSVVAAWRARFGRMRLLQAHCGEGFAAARDDFLACLERPDHRAAARVVACIATRPVELA